MGSPCGAGSRCARCPAGLADVRSTLSGSPDAAAVTMIAIPLGSGPLPCLLPADLAVRSSLAEEAPEDAHALAHCALGEGTRKGPRGSARREVRAPGAPSGR
jgi:hypothetical protein